MADVALVPERDVLEPRLQIAPQKPGNAGDIFSGDGVFLVGHARAARLPLFKALLCLAHLAALQMANFNRNPFDGRA